jgi:hypothetical protein
MGNVPRLVEKKVFGVENRSKSAFVSHGPSPGRQQACYNLGWEHATNGGNLRPDAIGDGANVGIMGCHIEPYNKSYGDGYVFGNAIKK